MRILTFVPLSGKSKRDMGMSDFYSKPEPDNIFEMKIQDKFMIDLFAKRKGLTIWQVEKSLKKMESNNDSKQTS